LYFLSFHLSFLVIIKLIEANLIFIKYKILLKQKSSWYVQHMGQSMEDAHNLTYSFSYLYFNFIFQSQIMVTTRKPEKTNGITDEIFLSVIITDENNSISKSVSIYRRHRSDGETVGIYWQKYFIDIYWPFRLWGIQFIWKYATAWWRHTILPTEWPRYSNWDSRIVTWHCHRRYHRWNHRRKESEKTIIYPPISRHSLPLFLLLLLSHLTSSLSNCSQPSIPTLHYSQHEHSSFLYLVRGHNIRFL